MASQQDATEYVNKVIVISKRHITMQNQLLKFFVQSLLVVIPQVR